MMKNRNLLVGGAAGDDAGVYRIGRERALVETVDFFTPIVDDPFAYGQIAAANALSDVYAMGGRPLTALNIIGFPQNLVSEKTIVSILRGGLTKAAEVGCAIIGGHSIRNPEPIYGLAVTGLVDLHKMMTNANARVGDLLLLTKPLGTGIVTTGIKRGLTSPAVTRKTIALMTTTLTSGIDRILQRMRQHATGSSESRRGIRRLNIGRRLAANPYGHGVHGVGTVRVGDHQLIVTVSDPADSARDRGYDLRRRPRAHH